jgi:predicted transposase YdaD
MPKTNGISPEGGGDIFDRSFKQIIGSLSDRALVCFINGLFSTDHPLDSPVSRLNTEQIDKNLKKRQPDEIVSIEDKIYVIEEQTGPDKNMAIRVFEYGYAQALKDKKIEDGVIILPFPRMIVIYLEAGGVTPDVLTIRLEFPDESRHDFKVETVKLLDYEVDDLAGKGLAPLLPFYIVKLRKEAKRAARKGTEEERRRVEKAFRELGLKLARAIEGSAREWPLDKADITTLLERLSGLVEYVGKDYRTTEVKEMINTSLMGYGKVLLMEGKQEGRQEGRQEVARNLKRMGMPLEQIVRGTGLSPEDIAKL